MLVQSSITISKRAQVNRKNQNLMLPPKAPYQKVSRTFVFEKEQTMQSQIIDLEIDGGPDPLDLAPILAAHTPLRARISLYDPAANAFLPLHRFNQVALVARRFLEPSIILLRYRERERVVQSEDSGSDFEADSGERRDMRSRERTVAEAIDLVKRWRGLHLNCPKPTNSRKKMNLQEAARALGVSKKSLDDYYCQLRLAEQHGFDFERHLHEKMGILRSFVKQRKADQERQQLRPHRHPKSLRIIEDFELQARLLAHLSRSRQDSKSNDSASVKAPSQPHRSTADVGTGVNSQGLMEINALESEFYRGFEFLLDDPPDPFIALSKDLSKRAMEEESEAILFI